MSQATKPLASEAHDISQKMIERRLGVTPTSISRWKKLGYLRGGERRPGVRGFFYRTKDANRLLRLIGSTAERFTDLDDA